MNILVTGANGQLGREMRLIAQDTPYHFIFTDVHNLIISKTERLVVMVI